MRHIIRVLEARSDEIKTKRIEFFGEISYYC